MGSQEFQRVRIGIDSNPLIDAKDYVLGKFSKEERKSLEEALTKTSEIIQEFKENNEFTLIMNKFN